MDHFVAEIVQIAIMAGAATIVAAILIGTRAWIKVTQIQADAQKQGDKEALAAHGMLRCGRRGNGGE